MTKAKEKALPVIRGNLKQRDVRNFELEMAQLPDRLIQRVSSSYHEAALKAAIGAGWIEDPACEKKVSRVNGQQQAEYYYGDTLVDDMHPKACYQAAHAIVELHEDFTSLDPT